MYICPQIFVFVYNAMQVPNVAWQSYLQLGLNFSPWVLVRWELERVGRGGEGVTDRV